MRNQMKGVFPEAALERLLAALECELIEATDEEILEAAHDLGMKPEMKGSAAFLGLRYAIGAHFADFFGTELGRETVGWLAANRPARLPKEPGDG
jgi:hypothetical protein